MFGGLFEPRDCYVVDSASGQVTSLAGMPNFDRDTCMFQSGEQKIEFNDAIYDSNVLEVILGVVSGCVYGVCVCCALCVVHCVYVCCVCVCVFI